MATAYLRCYNRMAGQGTAAQLPQEPPLSIITVSYTTTPATSTAFPRGTDFIGVIAGAAGLIEFGESNVAVAASSRPMAASASIVDGIQWFGVTEGQFARLLEGTTIP